jgi:hypothetical protein
MVKLQFTNAQVLDDGFGLTVNGRELTEILSTALGTRVDNNYGYNSGLPNFKSNCCNITITIDPQPVTAKIETDKEIWYSVEDMEEDKREQYQEKAEKESI